MTTASSISSLHEARRAFGRGIRSALLSGGRRPDAPAGHAVEEKVHAAREEAHQRTDDHA